MLRAKSTKPFSAGLQLAYTAFVLAHVWFNWHVYGPWNFLWECDVAVLTILVAIWTQSRFLTSVATVAAMVPMCLWITDLAARILLGHYIFGFAGYMFDRRIPRVIRLLSGFHLWLPLLLVWMISRVGYDRRAIIAQSFFMAMLLLVCRVASNPPPEHSRHEAVNINWVYGPSDEAPQTRMPPAVYLAMMMVLYPLLIYLPTHLVLCLIFARKSDSVPEAPAGTRTLSSTVLTCIL